MSEQILNALMQLFAIIARPDRNATERRSVVESFLTRQLNQELVNEYLEVFDGFYRGFVEEEEEKSGKKRRLLARRSVRVLKICTEINEELTQQQKFVVLIQLLEFIKSDFEEITEQEMEFVTTVADTFHITMDEYACIRDFVIENKELPVSPYYLYVDATNGEGYPEGAKHIHRDSMQGQIRFLYIPSNNLYFIKYLGQSEMYMNGQLVEPYKTAPFNTGSSIRNQLIIPIYYSDVVSLFVVDRVKSKIVFETDHIGFRFANGAIGLHDISFTEQSGRLVGIMGASGAGKSTLLNVLNGTSKPTSGSVLINGVDIHAGDPATSGIIGHVSQDDLLIEELSVFQNLYYNAKLCFDNYSEAQLIEVVHTVLKNLGLFEIKDIQVGSPLNKKISGGQRKRLNIALELIREPGVLFLDEPTSGLSSRDSENILDLLKELSLKGKLVFVVIHQPSSDIFKMFDRLLILDTGGYLIYNGNPIDSIMYFKSKVQHADWNESECPTCGNVNPEQIFNIVETSVLDEFGKLTHTRRISPLEWSGYFREEYKESEKPEAGKEDLPEISFKIPGKIKQFLVFLKRDILKKLSDTQYLVINFLEAPLLAFLLAYIVKYYNVSITNQFGYTLSDNSNLPVYIFMSVIVAIFMGLTVSAEEIIKDRKILKREAFLNLSWSSYLLSKVAVQFMLSALQALTFVLIGNSIMEIHGMYFHYWIMLFSAWTAANMMGLLISDSFKTVVTIYILIPFLVIPQIILSGIIVKYEKLNPQISKPSSIPFYGEIITARWAYEGLATYQFMENDYQKMFYHWDKVMSNAGFKSDFLIKDLQNKLAFIQENYRNKEESEKVAYNLDLLRNEIIKEQEARSILSTYYDKTELFRMKDIDKLYPEKINDEVLSYTTSYLNALRNFYSETYKTAYRERNNIKQTMDLEKLQALKRRYSNESLEEFVTNKNEFERIIEFKGRLLQKIDPIYLDPTQKLIKAHFYAPRKMLFGQFFPTFWINVSVIWLMTILLYILLYFRVLKKLLDLFEGKGKKG